MYTTFTQEKKDEVLAIAKGHQEQDRFVQGSWLKIETPDSDFHRGCYFGCMTQTENNTLREAVKQLNMPHWLVWLGEKIFEGLPVEQAKLFPVQMLEVIPVDTDTEKIWKQWQIALLTDQLRFVDKQSAQEKALLDVISLFKLDEIDLSAARSAAESAAAESAAAAAWSAAAESAARKNHYLWMRDTLLNILRGDTQK